MNTSIIKLMDDLAILALLNKRKYMNSKEQRAAQDRKYLAQCAARATKSEKGVETGNS